MSTSQMRRIDKAIQKLEKMIASVEAWQHDNPAEADLVQPAKNRLLDTLRKLIARRGDAHAN